MNTYKIVQNEQALRDFIDWLPELEPDEIYYLALFARKKYSPELKHSKTDKTQLKRFTSDKSRLLDKIRQLECPVGSYKLKDVVAPQESLALYITVNPRSQTLAARGSLKKLADLISNPYQGWNVHQEVMSQIQKAKSRTCWVDFDIDDKAVFDDKLPKLLQHIRDWIDDINSGFVISDIFKDACKVLETKGGYHILIDPAKIKSGNSKLWVKIWYKTIINLYEGKIDQVGDNMIPVVGCSQGDFVPRFLI